MRNWILVGLLALLLPFGAMAKQETIDFGSLDEAAIAELKAAVELKKAEAGNVPATEQISEYTVVGQQVAQALIAVASDLGKEVDEVLATTTGKLILAVIIWKIAGPDLIGLFVGFFWFVVMIPLWVRYFKKLCVYESEEYYENGKIKERNRYKDMSDNRAATFIIAAIVIVIVGMVIIFA